MTHAGMHSIPNPGGSTVYPCAGPSWHERLFAMVLPLVVGGFIALGVCMRGVKPPVARATATVRKVKTHFVVSAPQPRPLVKPRPVPVKQEKAPAPAPLDLTDKPVLAQTADRKAESRAETQRKVRRVYGLRKVYSRGIGSEGSLSDAVIGKLGNTLNAAVDTLRATDQDIKGRVVSTTTVTRAPAFRKRVKPEYTPAMIENGIEGVIKIKALIDIDGKVKKALALNDLGFEAARQALKASLGMEFEPAMRDSEPVAVWIIIPIRFVMLG